MRKRVIMLALALIMGLGLVRSAGLPTAYAYTCGNLSQGSLRCYGRVDWPGTNAGSSTKINVRAMACLQCNGFINSELWEESDSNTACSNINDICWVEGGYTIGTTADGQEQYFWADNRPGLGYRLFYLGDVGPYDYNNVVNVQISQDAQNNRWEMFLFNNDVSYQRWSTSNNMGGTRMTVGQELAGGPNGGYSPTVDFTYNMYVDAHSHTGYYQKLDGTLLQWQPPYANWAVRPSQSSTGGDLQAHCC